ncbi:LysM-like peptidoglycan-binding domain-containing protein [Photobacterium leiognathi]|uniref:LysM-like peptidoglycan-binding domain-containing protein n=1 Tax=Photobacterium leiognathi TaxID=553611 RepID=UPI00076A3814|nr:LysM-like peptidoglycan-binding domain-containing protein [Photobacterium leiognathi]
MGQAKRRSKTKQASQRRSVNFNISGITEKCRLLKEGVSRTWHRFPRFHRWALMLLVPIFVAVLMLPSPAQLEQDDSSATSVRRDIQLNLGGVADTQTTTNVAGGTVSNNVANTAVSKRTDVVLDTADVTEDKRMKAVGGLEDNGPAPEKKPKLQKIYPLNGGKAYVIDVATQKPAATRPAKPATSSTSTSSTTSKPKAAAPASAGQWVSYKVPAGKTLASVFRDRSLPLSDLFAIAKVEGAGKPISNVQAGQMLTYRVNSKGQIDGLKIDGNGISATYYRRSNGGYYRQ